MTQKTIFNTLVMLAVVMVAATFSGCMSDDANGDAYLQDVTLQTPSDSDDSSFDSTSITIKGLAADGASKLIFAVAADTTNPMMEVSVSSDVDWGVVETDTEVHQVAGKDYYLFTLSSEEKLPAALDNAAVATVNYTVTAKFSDGSVGSVTKSVEVVRPAVIFAHGLASNAETFTPMLNYIKPMGLFIDAALYALDYSESSTDYYKNNNRVVPEAIDTTLKAMLSAGYVSKKVTLIGHSMGGILTRIYMQDGVFEDDAVTQKEPYRGDLLKVITIDTPHSGSQLADFALELGEGGGVLSIFSNLGAIVDLAVNSDATADLNSYDKLKAANALEIPTHIIAAEIGTLSGIVELVSNEQYIYAVLSFFVDDIMSKLLYGDDDTSDIVVPMSSQLGGVENALLKKYVTTYENEWHCSVHTTETIANDIVALLNTESSDSKSFTTELSPAVLDYGDDNSELTASDLSIEEIQSGYDFGDTLISEIEIGLDDNDNVVSIFYDGNGYGDETNVIEYIHLFRVKGDGDTPTFKYYTEDKTL